MNKEHALRRFTGEQLAELSDVRASKEVVKRLRQAYFQRHNLSASERFSGAEVAEMVAGIIAKAKREAPQEEVVALLESIPHIRDEIGSAAIAIIVVTARVGETPTLSAQDLSKIGQGGYIEKLEEDFLTRANAKAEVLLSEERNRLREMIDLVTDEHLVLDEAKSILESVPPDANLELLIDQDPGGSQGQDHPIWWKELGLESDPFSSNRGLSDIPKDKYDDVVVRTPFVLTYVARIETEPDSFFGKTVVLLGEFGSGKTTLFQIVGSKAVTHGVLPILTSLHPDVSVSRLTTQLVGQIQETLVQTFPPLAEFTRSPAIDAGDEIGRSIQTLSEAIRRAPALRGFLLLVDGLHKTEAYLKQSLEFLSQLQTLQERFELRDLRLGILVAGSPRWERELKSNPALSGSFYAIETVPPISEDQAVEAVIRRIRSFTPAVGSPPTIVRAPLRTAYQVLVQRLLHPPTFRDYLDHVRDRFVARDYTTLGVSLRIHAETVRQVRTVMEASPLAPDYRILSDSLRQGPKVIDGLRRVLPELCVRKGIKDSDPFVEKNKGAFVVLMKRGWIVKRLDPTDRKLVWHLAEPVVQFLQKVESPPLKVLPSDALEALFTEVRGLMPGETESIYGPILRQMETMVATWRDSLPEVSGFIERALRKVREIDKKCRLEGGAASVDVSEETRTSLTLLVQAITSSVGAPITTDSTPIEVFRNLWCVPENFDAMVLVFQRTTAFDTSKPESYGLLLNHAQALSDLCELLTTVIRGEGQCRLAGRRLTETECIQLHTARGAFLSQQYQVTLNKVGELLEGKIRDVVYTASRCYLSDRAPTILPPDVRSRLNAPARGHPRATRPPDPNFLFRVNRSEYSKILFNREARGVLFSGLVTDEEVAQLKDQVELLFSFGDRDAHRDRPSYFREHATEIGDVLQGAPRMCDLLNRLAARLVEGSDFHLKRVGETLSFGFSGKGEPYASHNLSSAEVENLVRDLLGRIEAGGFALPPLESSMPNMGGRPELALGIIRACATQNLVTIVPVPLQFGYQVSMTDKGAARLSRLRMPSPGGP